MARPARGEPSEGCEPAPAAARVPPGAGHWQTGAADPKGIGPMAGPGPAASI